MTLALAAGISLAASLAAWRAHALTGSGAVAAGAIGTAILGSGGWAGGAVLVGFFVPSTLVGRLGARRAGVSDARGERRDAVQVLANGGPAALGVLAEAFAPGLGLWIVTAALAAASADTWATSVGGYSTRDPVDLVRGVRVPRGTSGGVTLAGSLGAAAGAGVVAATGALVVRSPALLLAGLAIGVGGMFLDSLLGALVQARFICSACQTASERRRHHCGTRTRLVKGWRWLDNDGVNALTTAAAALAGALVWVFTRG